MFFKKYLKSLKHKKKFKEKILYELNYFFEDKEMDFYKIIKINSFTENEISFKANFIHTNTNIDGMIELYETNNRIRDIFKIYYRYKKLNKIINERN